MSHRNKLTKLNKAGPEKRLGFVVYQNSGRDAKKVAVFPARPVREVRVGAVAPEVWGDVAGVVAPEAWEAVAAAREAWEADTEAREALVDTAGKTAEKSAPKSGSSVCFCPAYYRFLSVWIHLILCNAAQACHKWSALR
jgi:hypothetical protein